MVLLAFFGSAFPVVLFNIDRKKIIFTGIAGALGWIAYSIVFDKTGSAIMASFFGALALNIYSECMARILKTPASMFCIPGIFPLVPGITAYSAITYFVDKNFNMAQSKGLLTLGIAGAIGFGILISSSVIEYIFKLRKYCVNS
ncbi:threonine/serine exporter family protein [Clostridium oryzae]|nr:threonine/serine exporter family protein [Clostridium oryzae]